MPGGDVEDDAATVAELRRGDHAAFSRLIHRYHPELFAFAMRRLGTPDDVDDLLQDVFLAVWRQRERLAPDSSLRAYLYRAVRNGILNRRRDAGRSAHIFGEAADVVDVIDPEADASDTMEQAELRHAVDRAIATLPDRCREVWILCRERELSYAEAAAVLGIATGTVGAQMARAFRVVRAAAAPFLALLLVSR
jgi:RNA polymerase sigma-70 factor (ECF subfamily)